MLNEPPLSSCSLQRRQFHLLGLVTISAVALMGCAASTSSSDLQREPSTPALQVTFKTPDMQQHLEQLQLLQPLKAYWGYYAQRKWKERFEMERFQNLSLTPEAYETYYTNATKLKAIEVSTVYQDEKGRVRVQLQTEFESRENPTKTNSFSLSDWWELNESRQWLHLNHDPILHRGRVAP